MAEVRRGFCTVRLWAFWTGRLRDYERTLYFPAVVLLNRTKLTDLSVLRPLSSPGSDYDRTLYCPALVLLNRTANSSFTSSFWLREDTVLSGLGPSEQNDQQLFKSSFRLEDTVLSGLGPSEQDSKQQFKASSSLASWKWVPVHCLWPGKK